MYATTAHCVNEQAYLNNRPQLDKRLELTELNIQILLFTWLLLLPHPPRLVSLSYMPGILLQSLCFLKSFSVDNF